MQTSKTTSGGKRFHVVEPAKQALLCTRGGRNFQGQSTVLKRRLNEDLPNRRRGSEDVSVLN